jgi:hypothetical protein
METILKTQAPYIHTHHTMRPVRRAKDGNPHSTRQEEQYKYLNSGEEKFQWSYRANNSKLSE